MQQLAPSSLSKPAAWSLLLLLVLNSSTTAFDNLPAGLLPTISNSPKTVRPAHHTWRGRNCAAQDQIPVAGVNLTADELALLPDICWQPQHVEDMHRPLMKAQASARGIPGGTVCKPFEWCDAVSNYCTTVCERGTVVVDNWLKFAFETQNNLTRKLPLCYATLLGTHNSAITLADGYGNLDPYFQQYFSWIRWLTQEEYSHLRTNNQYLSLTDQMNLGVRSVELDTHWVEGSLRIAHCGGFHSFFDTLIKAINVIAKLLGKDIMWDTETIGCDPSLSSIPANQQRTLVEAFAEIAAWMAQPQNSREFLILYFDDQIDLLDWGLVPMLLEQIGQYFPESVVFTPADQAALGPPAWPSIDDLVANGKRVMLVSASDYGDAMKPLVFARGEIVCGWMEPEFKYWLGEPACVANSQWQKVPGYDHGAKTMLGQLYRISSCELVYGPMNCDFHWKTPNGPLLNEETLPDVANCGLNVPSPDLLTPSRAAAGVWSWAPGHPFPPSDKADPAFQGLWGGPLRVLRALLRYLLRVMAGPPGQCAAISGYDGRWRTASCNGSMPSACRNAQNVTVPAAVNASEPIWQLGSGTRGTCPQGFSFQVPLHGKDNTKLKELMQRTATTSAWLPLYGPEWKLP